MDARTSTSCILEQLSIATVVLHTPSRFPSSQEDALLVESCLAKAPLPVTGVLAPALALALRSSRRPPLHQVMLEQRHPQQLCVRVPQVLLPCMEHTIFRILCQDTECRGHPSQASEQLGLQLLLTSAH